MPSENKVVIATAGARKTTSIVQEALNMPDKKVLITTYTINNMNQIRDYIYARNGCFPSNIRLQTWFSFLLSECVRPYQNFLYDKRIKNICFVNSQSTRYVKKADTTKYYLNKGEFIYTDKISDFACRCNELSSGAVLERISGIYNHIFIDEVQDFAGYDFNILELLFASSIDITVVGDSRQATFFTNCSPKYRKYKGHSICDFFNDLKIKGCCEIEYRIENYRCNQAICDLSDMIYPEMPKSVSKNEVQTGHDGIFFIKESSLEKYISEYSPKILRNAISTNTMGFDAINFGESKGLSFERVLIFPTNPIKKFLRNLNSSILAPGSKSKLYVAITRARYSVAFVIKDSDANIFEKFEG
jgi:DNA helicase II / ATP-dependent DNA helicase PcrA